MSAVLYDKESLLCQCMMRLSPLSTAAHFDFLICVGRELSFYLSVIGKKYDFFDHSSVPYVYSALGQDTNAKQWPIRLVHLERSSSTEANVAATLLGLDGLLLWISRSIAGQQSIFQMPERTKSTTALTRAGTALTTLKTDQKSIRRTLQTTVLYN